MTDLTAFATVLPGAEPRIRFAEPMSRHSTFSVGGPADIFFEPQTTDEVLNSLNFARKHEIPVTVLGAGSNVVIADRGIRGLVLSFGRHFATHSITDGVIEARSGLLLAGLAAVAMRSSLGGIEFASGIPGTVGGAVMMNAGAYDHCLDEIITEVTCLTPELELRCLKPHELNFGYRRSVFSDGDELEGGVILGMKIELAERPFAEIRDAVIEYGRRRAASQPLEWPSAGSAFKRPPGYYAGKVISDCGLKGWRIGGAEVSQKHANFVINHNQATANDIRRLFRHIQLTVYQQTGITLVPEVRFIGDWDSAEREDLPDCALAM